MIRRPLVSAHLVSLSDPLWPGLAWSARLGCGFGADVFAVVLPSTPHQINCRREKRNAARENKIRFSTSHFKGKRMSFLNGRGQDGRMVYNHWKRNTGKFSPASRWQRQVAHDRRHFWSSLIDTPKKRVSSSHFPFKPVFPFDSLFCLLYCFVACNFADHKVLFNVSEVSRTDRNTDRFGWFGEWAHS